MVEKKFITPKFLTLDIAQQAIALVEGIMLSVGVRHLFHNLDGTLNYHITILVPAIESDGPGGCSKWPDYPFKPFVLAQKSGGRKENWTYPFDEIAQCKGLQLWSDRQDGGTDIKPHLLFSGDTPYWGGVKRDGIVVSCSGFECHIDRWVAGMVADALIALAYQAWFESEDKKLSANFLI